MRTTYGVVWREGETPLARGKLELLPCSVRLDGLAGSEQVALEIPYEELDAVRTGRTSSDRLNGQPTLVLERRDAESIVIASVAQAGVVAELTEHLAKQVLA
ncbi:MAG TPA: hypothetical protein VGP56_05085 [Gaiellaceae bacterium]|jgi:hypothetical protein|nr:hypothetical protein [Gaiellaceae bacterium]